MRLSLAGLAIGVLAAGSAYSQYVISAHSGVVQWVEGTAYLNDKAVELKFGQLPEIKDNQEFRTAEGKAEVLLTPGVFLRLGENSTIRMVSSKLTDTRVEVLSGSAMVECQEIAKDNAVMLLYKQTSVILTKHGLYRLDADPARFQVFDGEAIVKGDSGQVTLRAGKQTKLDGVLMAENFDKKDGDELYRWSSRRAAYLAKANLSSANGLRSSGSYNSGWLWNSLFGLYTWVPYRGYGYSPFGYSIWSPASVYRVYYNPRPVNSGNSAWSTYMPSNTNSGMSGFPVSSGHASGGGSVDFSRGAASAPAASAPVSAPAGPAGGGGGPVHGR